jgi:two-component system phosphate regulon sensor histidine kinase PhoR
VARPRLFWRIFATYLVVVVLCTAAVGFYAVRSVRGFYFDHTESELAARAALVREQILPDIAADTPEELEALVQRLGRSSGTRITVIAADRPGAARGEILADSDSDPVAMENHRGRPEFLQAVSGVPGRAIRYSDTLRQDMMYVAVPVEEDGRVTTVIRAAVALTRVNEALSTLYGSIAASAVVAAVIAALIGLYVSRRISGQMREIKVGAATSPISSSCRAWRSSHRLRRASTGWRRNWTTSCAGSPTNATSARRCWRAWSRACSPWTPRSA